MIIMFLDIASKSGVAITNPADPSRPLLETLTVDGDHPKRFYDYRRGLWKLLVTHRPHWLVYEAALPPSNIAAPNFNTSLVLLGLIAVTSEAAYAFAKSPAGNGYPQIGDANNAAVRRHFIGTNRGKSPDLKHAVKMRCIELGWEFGNDNEADAAAGWSYWAHRYGAGQGRTAA